MTIFPIVDNAWKCSWFNLLCQISVDSGISWLSAKFCWLQSLYKLPSLTPIMIAFLMLVFLGQDRTLSSWKGILYPWSERPDIETRFLLIRGTYKTLLSWRVMPESSGIEQDPIPLIGCVELSPLVTSSEWYSNFFNILSLKPVMCRDAPLSMIQVFLFEFNSLESVR